MKSKKITSKNNIIRICILAMTILIIILVILICIMQNLKKQNTNDANNISNTSNTNNNQSATAKSSTTSNEYQLSLLKQGTERDRIEYYCGQFLKFIENKNYEKAYEILYPEFKQEYFPTIEKFTEYIQKTYPSILAINYDDFDRQGNIYITTVIIDDALATDKTKQFKQRIIVQESDYNKYVLSFQVI